MNKRFGGGFKRETLLLMAQTAVQRNSIQINSVNIPSLGVLENLTASDFQNDSKCKRNFKEKMKSLTRLFNHISHSAAFLCLSFPSPPQLLPLYLWSWAQKQTIPLSFLSLPFLGKMGRGVSSDFHKHVYKKLDFHTMHKRSNFSSLLPLDCYWVWHVLFHSRWIPATEISIW